MKIYLLRHGEAGSSWQTSDDSQRPLTPEGVIRMQKQAQTLYRWGVRIDALVSSTYLRAHQTANAIAAAFNVPVIDEPRLRPGCTPETASTLAREHSAVKHLWLVGHEPDLSEIVTRATGGAVEMKKGSLACLHVLQVYPLRGTLEWLLTANFMLFEAED